MKSRSLFVLCLLWATVSVAGPVRTDEVTDKVADKVDKVFEPFNRTDTPGCAVGVIRDGQLV